VEVLKFCSGGEFGSVALGDLSIKGFDRTGNFVGRRLV
jgi:hypothetical protein